jgi:hypothetical protein
MLLQQAIKMIASAICRKPQFDNAGKKTNVRRIPLMKNMISPPPKTRTAELKEKRF